MFPVLRKSRQKKNAQLNAMEAFSLWEMLNSKYTSLEKIAIWENYAHDVDLKLYLHSYSTVIKGFVRTLEQALVRYGIKGPDAHVLTANTLANSDIIRDQLIATDVFVMLQEHVEMLLMAIGSSTTNDNVRKIFIDMVHKDLEQLSFAVKYCKTKGWLYVPPMFPQSSDVYAKIDAAEAFNLWSHLTYRYDNLQLTQIFLSMANDGDFKLLLKAGRRLLLRQIKTLEKELRRFGIAFPVRPPAVMPPGAIQAADDDNMLRTIFSGMTGALTVHAKAVKQSTTNDRVRKLFTDLLIQEIDHLDRIIKYGKMKGWLNPAPSFGFFK